MIAPQTRRTLLAGAAAALAVPARAQGVYWPTAQAWETREPATAGLDAGRLAAALDRAMAANSTSLLVLRGGRIVAERYGAASGPGRGREVASVGKSLLAVLVGMAIDEQRIARLDHAAADFVPAWREGPRRAITIRHLLSMTSGLDDRGLALRNVAGDQFALNSAAPLRDPPGMRWAYNTAAYHLLFHIVARAAGEPFEAYAQRKLLGPLGMAGTTWLTNRGQGAGGPVTNYYTAICTARDLGRFGLFALRGGQWGGRQLVSRGFMRSAVAPSQDLNPSYGLLWWSNRRPGVAAGGRGEPALRFPGSPPDTFAALGAGGQAVMVVPSRDLVVVRQGDGAEGMLPQLLAEAAAAVRS